jgi:hypothetical protein
LDIVGSVGDRAAETTGSAKRSRRKKTRKPLSTLSFLKPTNPQEALALFLLCSLLIGTGAGALKALESIFADAPWNVRADRVCLDAGDEYLSVEGQPLQRMHDRIEITGAALSKLRDIGNSAPIDSTLAYQSMLREKVEMLRLMKRKRALLETGKSTGEIDNRLEATLIYGYGPKAEELGLYVCGQGSGWQ